MILHKIKYFMYSISNFKRKVNFFRFNVKNPNYYRKNETYNRSYCFLKERCNYLCKEKEIQRVLISEDSFVTFDEK